MKPLFAAALLVALTCSTFGETPWPPKVIAPKFETVQSADLPKALQDALLHYDDYAMGTGTLPDQLQVFQVHLKADNAVDYFIEVPQGFSGGPEFDVFELRSYKFINIGGGQGLQYLGPQVNGHYQIIMLSRGGGGNYTRILTQYGNDNYVTIRMADYKIADDKLHFVRERTVSEFQPKAF